jgi:ribosome-associated protein
MDVDVVRRWLETSAPVSFARSSGPGGQNVNKLNTKSVLRVAIAEIPSLTAAERAWLTQKLAHRLAAGGVLVVQAQDERSQSMNRALAVERALAAITRGLHRDRPRRATRPSRAAKQRRLDSKKLSSRTKQQRARPDED